MAHLIAGLYEIDKEIGSGGGGIVYSGYHTRLKKKVVLKADRRTLKTKEEALRREVDLLKNLSHRYIPQVFDFVQEDGVVYTVMDYIEGESLDKALLRGERYSQVDVIRWACQLLDALSYLHGVPPFGILHGDIKPANIILRPNGDICLIDYNIALALGEDGAVKVGYSLGYASPEHYGEYENTPVPETVHGGEKTELLSGKCETTVLISPGSSTPITRNGKKIDQRSDIYCLGATLYHLISGVRPASKATEIQKLGTDICSKQVSDILAKAMNPDPEKRYQSAEEMLKAFLSLHRNDYRVKERKKRIIAFTLLHLALFITGLNLCFAGMKEMRLRQNALDLSAQSADALSEGDIPEAVAFAMDAVSQIEDSSRTPVPAEAQKALTDALSVYDLRDGFKSRDVVNLPSEPFYMTVSPEGTKFAVVYAYEAAVYDFETLQCLSVFDVIENAKSEFVFTDGEHGLISGRNGLSLCDVTTGEILWSKEKSGRIALSGSGKICAAAREDLGGLTLYRVADGKKDRDIDFDGGKFSAPVNDIFADFKDDLFCLDEKGKYAAVSLRDGSLKIYDLASPDDSMIIFDESDYKRFTGGFSGKYFAFSAENDTGSIFALIDTEEASCISEYESEEHIYVKAEPGRFLIANGGLLEELDTESLSEQEIAFVEYENITGFSDGEEYSLLATDGRRYAFYNQAYQECFSENSETSVDFPYISGEHALIGSRESSGIRVLSVERHKDSFAASYDPNCVHDEARISGDRTTIMLFDYQSFSVFDMKGSLLARVELPDAENIYDQQYRKGQDSCLEVIWYDGTRRKYSAEDGALLSTEKGAKPDESLYEELMTDHYIVKSTLHKAAVICEKETGAELKTLENEAHLTYATEVPDGLVVEYMTTEGRRYGYYLNKQFEVVAELPDLCDISGNGFVFDYGDGVLREAKIYSLNELVELGKNYIE